VVSVALSGQVYLTTRVTTGHSTVGWQDVGDLQERVAQTADAADMHATVPALLLELQTLLGGLTATATAATGRGRRPFRPTPEWSYRLGELAYGVYLLADQSGVDVADAVELTAQHLELRAQHTHASDQQGWPF
jgi:hypothetical protein